MEPNKDIAGEIKKLEKLGLPKEAHEVLMLLFDKCYLIGRLMEIRNSQKNLKVLMDKLFK